MRLPPRIHRLLLALALMLCFGAAGLLWLLPSWRRRRAERLAHCAKCRRHQGARTVLFVGFAAVLTIGAGTRAYASVEPPILCHSHVSSSGEVRPEPLLELASADSRGWNTTRRIIVAPTSGLALIGGRAAGMHQCSGPPLLVTFWWPPRASGGTTIGDTFLTWTPDLDQDETTRRRLFGTGISAEGSFVRFGPNISTRRISEERLGRHETRHLDQWAVFTVAGGPLALPIAYYVDSLFFPLSRSHFERHAGLAEGGYAPPPDGGPAPLWAPITVLGIGLLVATRTHFRLLFRTLAHGRRELTRSRPNRCPRHTTGWSR